MNQQNQQNEPERSFESLNFYQDSLKLLKASYRLAEDLPNYERYNLSGRRRRSFAEQLRRAT